MNVQIRRYGQGIGFYLFILVFCILTISPSALFAGSIVAWGENSYGETTPPAESNFIVIAAGDGDSFAIKSDGSIVSRGYNGFGECNIPAGNNFIAIAAGFVHALALKSDGSIVGWGYNRCGQINVPDGNNFIAIAAGQDHSLALKSDGSIVGWGDNSYGETTPPAGHNFIAIAAGGCHSLALKYDSSIVGWGYNPYGECNVPAGNNFIAIAAGNDFSLALKSDGSIVAWGDNTYGECNVPAGNNFIAIAAGAYHSLALKSDGSIVTWGDNTHGQFNNIPDGNNFIAIAAGYWHSLALQQVPETAALLLHAPNGSEVLGGLQTYTISWSSTGMISEVLIEYSTDNGQDWNTVSPPNIGNTGSYEWWPIIPPVDSNECLIRISDATDSNVGDISDNVFELKEQLSLIQPKRGERIIKGSYYNILWSSNFSGGPVFIQYSTDGGGSWQPVATTENTGSYNWHITGPESGDYLIWISDTNGYGGFDRSCDSFAVYSCLEQIAEDLNGDCVVDFEDFAILASNWLQMNYVTIAKFAFDANPGWTMQGQWQFGLPAGMGGSSHGYPDPNAAYTGQNVYGVNLNGDYTVAVGGPYALIAGPFDCNSYETVEFSFARWLNTDTADYVQCKVEASNDGSTWQTVWVNPTTEPITDNQWQVVEYDISQIAAGHSQVYVRWSYQVLNDRAFPYSGWNIDDVELHGYLN